MVTSLSASAAGEAIIAAQRSVLSAGVMIALALVPAMTICAMGIAVMDHRLVWRGLVRWAAEAAMVTIAAGLVLYL